MGIKKRHVPGCTCCECLLAARSDFSQEVTPGDWTDGGTYWETSQSDAIKYTTITTPGQWSVICPYSVTFDAIGERAVIRVLGGYQDENNYVYGEIDYQTWPGGTNNGWSRTNRIGKVVAGVNTVLAEQPWTEVQEQAFGGGGELTGTRSGTLTLCYDGVTSLAMIMVNDAVAPGAVYSAGGPGGLEALGVTTTGYAAGIATGTLTAVQYVRFTSTLQFTRCPACGYSCCHGTVPENLQVVFADASPYQYVTWIQTYTYRMDCAEIMGTFTLAANEDYPGDRNCQWDYSFTVDVEYFNGGVWNPATRTARIYAIFQSDRFEVTVRLTNAGNLLVADFQELREEIAIESCEDWSSFSIAIDSGASASTCTQDGDMTCSVTAL